MKLDYSEPQIYSGGVSFTNWSKLSKNDQQTALNKDWYVYYSFRNPVTGKLVRQPNIKAGANKFKNKKDRLQILQTLQRNLLYLLNKGFSPYQDNSALELAFFNDTTAAVNTVATTVATPLEKKPTPAVEIVATPLMSIDEAFDLALKIKQKALSATSYSSFKSSAKRFRKWLSDKTIDNDIEAITKKMVIEYLNSILENTSARTRNNTRIDLSTLFQTLYDNEIVKNNFVKSINVLKSVPERNKTYTTSLQHDLYEYMAEKDPLLLLFVKFISYNFLRPVEVCRLKVGDLDLVDRKLFVKAKNAPVKTKIIPEILIQDLPDLSIFDKNDYLFTPDKVGGKWETAENDKRDYFSKRFKKIKDHFGLDKNYGLYSFRHTFITRLYEQFAKTLTPYEAKSKLMVITGHLTMDALEKYLRNIDAVLPEDYSEFL